MKNCFIKPYEGHVVMGNVKSVIKMTLLGIFFGACVVLELSSDEALQCKLHNAVEASNIEMVKQCIAQGACIDNEIESILNSRYGKSYDSSQYSQQLELLKKTLDFRAKLVEQGLIPQKLNVEFFYRNDCYARDYARNFAFLEALLTHHDTHIHEAMLARLLNDVVVPQTCEWKTAECSAILHKKICALNLLLAHGAHANMKNTSEYGCSSRGALYNALNYGYHVVNGAQRNNRFTPSEPIVKLLIQAGANVHERTDNGCSLLHAAAQSEDQNAGLIRLFVELGVPLNDLASSWRGGATETALHVASRNGRYAMTRELLQAGANASIQDSWGYTSLYWALKEDAYDIALLLMDHTDLSRKDTNGLTAWDHFSGDKKGNLAHGFVEKCIARGIDINSQGAGGRTALHRASAIGSYSVVKALLEHGARIDMRDVYGNTALHLAVHARILEKDYPRIKGVIQLLRTHGADITISNNEGKTVCSALEEIDRQDRIHTYFGKNMYELCKENAQFKQVWNETWWDVHFSTIRAWLKKPSPDLATIRSMSRIISECIEFGEQALANKGNRHEFLRDSGNVAVDVVSAVVLFPWALLSGYGENKRMRSLQKALRIMKETKEELDERADLLQELLSSSIYV